MNSLSIPENNPKWKDEFMYLLWDEGDWGTLFRSSFGRVMDGSPNDIVLLPEDQETYDALINDNGQIHSKDLLNEMTLREVGISPVSEKGISRPLNIFLLFYESFVVTISMNIFYSLFLFQLLS